MLLALARAASELGCQVTVIGPAHPGGVVDAAKAAGYDVVALAGDRRRYLKALRTWDRTTRRGLLWCNGLVPAVATAGRPRRVVHLHQAPTGAQRVAARLASRGALRTFVPSRAMADRVTGARILWNWSAQVVANPRSSPGRVVGFLGRPSVDKGIVVLTEALVQIRNRMPDAPVRLLLAGEPRFVSARDRQCVESAIAQVADLVDEVGWTERAAFFGAVDVAVFPSVWPEPFGLVVTEAMSCRAPFIISDAGALPEVAGVDHPWVVPAGDPAALGDAILAALAQPRQDREPMLDAAHERWQTLFSPSAGRERLAHTLTEVGVLP